MTPYYQDQFATIYHGDCRAVLPTLPKADLVLTDPPYGLDLGNQLWTYQRGAIEKGDWDQKPFTEIDLILASGEHQIIWGGNYYTLPPTRCWLSWYKPDAVPSMAQFELAWTNLDRTARQITCSIAQTNGERVGHPTQKPLRVILWCLQFAPAAKTVLDPFMGSGTTLVAAKQLGRRAIGIELEERYCEIAAKRLSQEYLPLNATPEPPRPPEPELTLA